MNREGIVCAVRRGEGKQERARQFRRAPTPQEAALWECLRANRLDGLHFRRQQVIDGFIADFYCHSAGVVIELDGSSHRGREEYDALRDQIIGARGLTILRFRNDQVEHDMDGLLEQIRRTIQQTRPAPPPQPPSL